MANPRDKSNDSPDALGWADGDLARNAENAAAKRKALGLAPTAFGIPAPPPAAPPPAGHASPADHTSVDDDPVASLFRADQTLRAPSIPAAPSEAEVTRWRATVRTSMFDEQVSDPMPGDGEPLRDPAPAAARAATAPAADSLDLAIDPRIAARARARAEALAGISAPVAPPPAAAPGTEPAAAPRRRAAAPAPSPAGQLQAPPPAAESARRAKDASARSGVRSKSEPQAPLLAVEPPAALHGEPHAPVQDDAEPAPVPRRRLQRGPGPVLLGVLAVAALLTFGSAAVMIGLVRNPLASEARIAPQPARASAPKPRAAAKPSQPKPAAAAPPAQTAAAVEAKAADTSANAKVAPAKANASSDAKVNAAADAKTAPAEASVSAAEAAPSQQGAPQPPAAASVKPAAAKLAPAPASAPAPKAQTAAAPADEEPEAESARAKPSAAAAPDGAAVSTSALFTAARKFLAEDEPAQAEAAMRQVLAIDPVDHHAMELLVRALMDQDRGPEALPFARKMVQRRARRVAYRLLLGDVLLMVGDEAGARAEWQEALALQPGDREIMRRLGM